MGSDGSGGVTVALALLEPYVFSVRPQMGSEYMPQEFAFLTDRQSLTVVVARSVLGTIKEENVVFLLDVSGSMQVYLEDVKSAVNLALVQQFHRTRRRFNLVTFTEYQIEFRSQLVPATPENLEEAMRFCQHTQAGGGSYLAPAVRDAFWAEQDRPKGLPLSGCRSHRRDHGWQGGGVRGGPDASQGRLLEAPPACQDPHSGHQLRTW
ncbi:unnamed protein product [Durusdinium trenchii]|uniref:VWFA domain-containing protein n=1 Tax=Durusdinium trenchii TaxID=1381693 RepID=A0ABP0MF13_9DINO